MGENRGLAGPDLAEGVDPKRLEEDEPFLGHFEGAPVILVRKGDEVFAIGGSCSHYGFGLDGGLVVEDTVRCPGHHACFSLRTGQALRAPALNDVPTYEVETRDGVLRVTSKKTLAVPKRSPRRHRNRVVIVGTGAAGAAAAETLRREGHAGEIVMVGEDPDLPYDRPNLSKDYLAGTAPEEWIPLRSAEHYRELEIDVRSGVTAASLDPRGKTLQLGRDTLAYDALILATGAEPRRLEVPGAELPHVHLLRSLADARRLIAATPGARRAVVVGASFIGMEAAASLRARGLEVTVTAPEPQPFQRTLGTELGAFLRALHEQHGVRFALGTTVQRVLRDSVELADGTSLPADLVVVGVGVRPRVALAQAAGLRMEDGVVVNELLETSAKDVFAAGDIARWPDPHTGKAIRVEHWTLAQRMGQAAARNVLGAQAPFDAVPFFWTTQFGVTLQHVGHAEGCDRVEVDGRLTQHNARVTFYAGDKVVAVAAVGRELELLEEALRCELEVRSRKAREARASRQQ